MQCTIVSTKKGLIKLLPKVFENSSLSLCHQDIRLDIDTDFLMVVMLKVFDTIDAIF